MATRFKSRARRSRRYLTIVKPSGSLHLRVQKVGPEHFGMVSPELQGMSEAEFVERLGDRGGGAPAGGGFAGGLGVTL